MSHALVTIIGKVPEARVDAARGIVEALGNPASPGVQAAFEAIGAEPGGIAIHFSSLTVFPATGGGGHLVFEFSGDGPQDALIDALARHLGPHVAPAFELTNDRGSESLGRYLASHVVTVGHGFFSNPGIVFAGTPGLSVARIRRERALRDRLNALVGEAAGLGQPALATVDAIRARLRDDPNFAWALDAEDAAALDSEKTLGEAVPKIVFAAIRTFLWPLAIPPALAFLIALAMDMSRAGFGRALMVGVSAAVVTAVVAVLLLGIAYLVFRRREASEMPDSRPPDPAAVGRIMARENHASQNHLAAVNVMKPGLLRKLTLRLVFAAIAWLATYLYRPGLLGTIGTIHFARWVTVPGTPDLVFLSNYGGSWESYLEDFITKAHFGLTGVWSNTQGFPRTVNLVQLGASDGDHFKHYARRSQVPTGCWYTAYPDLTTTNIRMNAAIRQGLGTILTDEEARRWLTFFGSNPRPASAMEVNEIQSLVFGGLGFLPFAMCLGFRLDGDRDRARAWLREATDAIAFGDGLNRKHVDRAVILALAAGALETLQVPRDSLLTFPPAFLDGMSSPTRARILGDHQLNAPDRWEWGGPQNPVDGVLLLYAADAGTMEILRGDMESRLASHGHRATIVVPFMTLPTSSATSEQRRRAKLEPFGFVDGVSQPAIRGTYKALRGADPIHIVEPGEFVLGYPDNRGNLPATPTLAAIHDPRNLLPIAAAPQHGFARPIVNDDRDLGRNGTFLAVRQLEQNVDGFWEYCSHAADDVRQLFPRWIDVTPEFVGAKLVGRWPDGSSLVRFPYRPGSEEAGDEHPMLRTGGLRAQAGLPAPPPPVAASRAQSRDAATPRARLKKVEGRQRRPDRDVAITPDNDFLFGAEDPQGLRCPFSSHIRRANPRESFDPGSDDQLAITNRHRIMRVGRRYEPQSGRNPGLFFMCLNADIERQFEFIQQTWLQAPSFHGVVHERDPIVGGHHLPTGEPIDDGYTIPTREGPVRLSGLPEFVRVLGGGYFFIPGKSVLRYLSS